MAKGRPSAFPCKQSRDRLAEPHWLLLVQAMPRGASTSSRRRARGRILQVSATFLNREALARRYFSSMPRLPEKGKIEKKNALPEKI